MLIEKNLLILSAHFKRKTWHNTRIFARPLSERGQSKDMLQIILSCCDDVQDTHVLCPKFPKCLPLISAKYAAPTLHRERGKDS